MFVRWQHYVHHILSLVTLYESAADELWALNTIIGYQQSGKSRIKSPPIMVHAGSNDPKAPDGPRRHTSHEAHHLRRPIAYIATPSDGSSSALRALSRSDGGAVGQPFLPLHIHVTLGVILHLGQNFNNFSHLHHHSMHG